MSCYILTPTLSFAVPEPEAIIELSPKSLQEYAAFAMYSVEQLRPWEEEHDSIRIGDRGTDDIVLPYLMEFFFGTKNIFE